MNAMRQDEINRKKRQKACLSVKRTAADLSSEFDMSTCASKINLVR